MYASLSAALLTGCIETQLEKVTVPETGAPAIDVSPARLDFGPLPHGEAAALPLTITNVGTAALAVDGLALGGAGGGAFTLTDTLTGRALAPDESVSVDVIYTVNAPSASDAVRVASDDPATPSVFVPLTGLGDFGLLEVDPTPIAFGHTDALSTLTQSATLTNVGAAPLEIRTLLVAEEAFALPTSPSLPLTLAAGDSTAITLTFTPPTDGWWAGHLWAVTDDPVGTHAVPLEGSAGESFEEPEDVCEDPDFGDDPVAGTRIYVQEGGALVTVTYLGTDAGYTSELWLEEPVAAELAVAYQTRVGTSVELGPFDAGTELVFGVRVRDTGDRFRSGPGGNNPDGVVHAATTYVGDCTWRLGFEDLWGGGDTDYDDIQMSVRGALGQTR